MRSGTLHLAVMGKWDSCGRKVFYHHHYNLVEKARSDVNAHFMDAHSCIPLALENTPID